MGTNYYFLTRDKALVQEAFVKITDNALKEAEYQLTDSPYLGYEIHICKFSCGWRAVFQSHHCYHTLKELDQFYHKHSDKLEIFDEYNEPISWDALKTEAISRGIAKPVPQKWVYELDHLFPQNPRKTLHTIECQPEEAELWIPFDHILYHQTKLEARRKFYVYPEFDIRASPKTQQKQQNQGNIWYNRDG